MASLVIVVSQRWPVPGPRLLDHAPPEQHVALVSLGLLDPPGEAVTALADDSRLRSVPLRRVPLATTNVALYLDDSPRR